jgi:hypothetical protein
LAGLVPAISIQMAQLCHIKQDACDKRGHDTLKQPLPFKR